MLKQLRLKFVAIATALVAVVALISGAVYLMSTRSVLDAMVERALGRGLTGDIEAPPVIGPSSQAALNSEYSSSKLAVANILIDDAGNVLRRNEGIADMDQADLEEIIGHVLSGEQEGYISDEFLRWATAPEDGNVRIAVVDTEDIENAFRMQAVSASMVFLLTTTGLSLVAWFLSSWAFAPTLKSWQQQKKLVADLSHDLKTPLAVILSNAHILKQTEAMPESSMRWIEGTEYEARSMQDLIEQMLELARIDETGNAGIEHESEEVDLSVLAEGVVLQFEPLAFEDGIHIEEQIEDGIRVKGDAKLLERLMTILIDNACKYSDAGSLVNVMLSAEGHHALFQVTNYGEDIAQEDLEHVFDRFWRSNSARTRDGHEGHGLGLAIAKGIAENHGGSISVESANSKTTFSVRI